jgi:hypothetical protein
MPTPNRPRRETRLPARFAEAGTDSSGDEQGIGDSTNQNTMDQILETVQAIQAELREAKEETKLAREETKLAREETKLAREETRQLRNIVEKLEGILSNQGSRRALSYASAAVSGGPAAPNTTASLPDSRPSLPTTLDQTRTRYSYTQTRNENRTKHELAKVTLDLSKTGIDIGCKKDMIELINLSLEQNQDTKGIKCQGIIQGKPDRTIFVFNNDKEAQKVTQTEPWTVYPENRLSLARKIIRKLYKVRLQGLPEEWFNQTTRREAKPEIRNEISKATGTNIAEIRQMGGPRYKYVRAVAECFTKEDQLTLLNRGYITIDGAYIEIDQFIELPTPRQCLNCWQFGHNATTCREERLCKQCGEQGHEMKECMVDTPKCPNCQEQHIATARECRTRRTAAQPTRLSNVS